MFVIHGLFKGKVMKFMYKFIKEITNEQKEKNIICN